MRVLSQFLLLLLLFATFCDGIANNTLANERLFLIGDSVDRQIVIDWCNMHKIDVVTQEVWGLRELTYRKGIAAYHCATKSHSIGFIHAFGSAATGPYLNNFKNSPTDQFVDTKPRIRRALEIYSLAYGTPTRVLMSFASWDAHYILREKIESNRWGDESWLQLQVQTHKSKLKERLQEVQTMLPDADVGLRTAVETLSGKPLVPAYNMGIRNLAKELNITMFDFDFDLWSGVNPIYDHTVEYLYFRDHIHPKQIYTAFTGNKMVGMQYSSSMIFRDIAQNLPESGLIKQFYFITSEDRAHFDIPANHDTIIKNLYYRSPRTGFLYGNVASCLASTLKLSLKTDVLFVSSEVIATFTKGYDVPSYLCNCKLFEVAEFKSEFDLYYATKNINVSHIIRHNNDVRNIKSPLIAEGLQDIHGICPLSTNDVDVYFPPFAWGSDLSEKLPFRPGQMQNLLIQYEERTVYVVQNRRRHSLKSIENLYKIHKSFDDVNMLLERDDLDLIPPLQRACTSREVSKGLWVRDSSITEKLYYCCGYDGHDHRHNIEVCGGINLAGLSDYQAREDIRMQVGGNACLCDKKEGRSSVNRREKYSWVPHQCSLNEWNPDRFCELLRDKKILFVGDSTSIQTANALMAMTYKKCATNLYTARDDNFYGNKLIGFVERFKPDILIVSYGPHAQDNEDVRIVLKHIQEMLRKLEEKETEVTNNMKVLWKTINPGHRDCLNATGPVPFFKALPNQYHWERFPAWDAMAVNANITYRNYPVGLLDMGALYYRPDAHPGGDCLHSCLPGPIDIVGRILLQMLENGEI